VKTLDEDLLNVEPPGNPAEPYGTGTGKRKNLLCRGRLGRCVSKKHTQTSHETGGGAAGAEVEVGAKAKCRVRVRVRSRPRVGVRVRERWGVTGPFLPLNLPEPAWEQRHWSSQTTLVPAVVGSRTGTEGGRFVQRSYTWGKKKRRGRGKVWRPFPTLRLGLRLKPRLTHAG
jgi:hypothetical protein